MTSTDRLHSACFLMCLVRATVANHVFFLQHPQNHTGRMDGGHCESDALYGEWNRDSGCYVVFVSSICACTKYTCVSVSHVRIMFRLFRQLRVRYKSPHFRRSLIHISM